MRDVFSLLPLYAIIAVLGIQVIAIVIFVQAAVRISHALSAQAKAIEDIAVSMKTATRIGG